jgi:hypothetical protein
MVKRKHEEAITPELKAYQLSELAARLEADDGRTRLAQASLTMAQLGGLTIPDLRAISETVPAFNKAQWEKVAPQFDLEADKDMTQLGLFAISRAFLPPSFHREVMRNASWWLDVYQETGVHTREAARVRLMDAVS